MILRLIFKNYINFSVLQRCITYSVLQNNSNSLLLLPKNDKWFYINEYPKYLINKPTLYLTDFKNYSSKKNKEKGAKIDKPKVELRKEEINEVINYDDLINGFREATEKLKNDLIDNFNLRVTPSSFEQLTVKTPEGNMKLGEIAQVEYKSPSLYQINMIDTPDYVKQVFDAILKSNLNTNAQLDKTTINLPIAKVTRERREHMTKNIKLKCEQALKKMRDIESKALRKAKENKKISSDLSYNVSQHVKYQFELYSKQACDLRDSKINEILKE